MFSENWHRRFFLFGLISLFSGLLFGSALISISQFILGLNWFLEKRYTEKLKSIFSNPYFYILCSVFILHIIGFTYTSDIYAGLNDLKTKVPLVVFAIVFLSTKPLSAKEFEWLFNFFIASVVISSVWCFLVYNGITHKKIIDIRDASVFMSHIRFSIIIAFTILSICYFSFSKKTIILVSPLIIWLLYFMLTFQMATGLFILVTVTTIFVIIYMVKHINKYVNLIVLLILTSLAYCAYLKIKSDLLIYNKQPLNSYNQLLNSTINNNLYAQDTTLNLAENGNLITVNFCDIELKKEWGKRSNLDFNEKDNKGNSLRFTIYRYMSSKGLIKDSSGIAQLNNKDIVNIENGVSNFKYADNSGLEQKWRELIWEYNGNKRNENPSGHTLSMRLEFWETALFIIKQNPLFGVGTGDIQTSFNQAYNQTHSKLSKEWRLKCHNQYLAITVAFGFIGFIIFINYLMFPALTLRKKLHDLYWPFILIILLSFLTEDTLESQAGLTFFGIFNTLFIWLASCKEEKN
jgi:O-antigen ligase